MAEINKPDFTQLWANAGAKSSPSSDKINTGWVVEIPPHQFDNWVQNRQDQGVGYLFQRGVPEWDSSTEYFANKSVTMAGGKLYIAITNNTNQNPTTQPTHWKVVVPDNISPKMEVKNITLPYTLTADDKFKYLVASGTGNLIVPAGIFASADWVIVSRVAGGASTVVASGTALRAQYTKTTQVGGAGARIAIVCVGANTFDLMGDFLYA